MVKETDGRVKAASRRGPFIAIMTSEPQARDWAANRGIT